MKTHKEKCKEAADLLQYGYPNTVIAARCEISVRDVEEIRQICKIFVPVYSTVSKGNGRTSRFSKNRRIKEEKKK